jgi:hypothetical protein
MCRHVQRCFEAQNIYIYMSLPLNNINAAYPKRIGKVGLRPIYFGLVVNCSSACLISSISSSSSSSNSSSRMRSRRSMSSRRSRSRSRSISSSSSSSSCSSSCSSRSSRSSSCSSSSRNYGYCLLRRILSIRKIRVLFQRSRIQDIFNMPIL